MCPHTMRSHLARANRNPSPPPIPLLILSWKRFDLRKSKWFRFTSPDVYLTLPACGLPSCLGSRSCYLGRMNGGKDVTCPLHGREWVVASASPKNREPTDQPHEFPTMWRRQTQPERLSLCKLGVLSHAQEEKQRTCWGLEKWTPTSLWGDIPGENGLFLYHPIITATFPSP